MKKLLFSGCAVLAILGCGGDMNNLPPFGSEEYPYSSGSSGYYGYCFIYGTGACEYMYADICYNYYGGSNYGDDSTCGSGYSNYGYCSYYNGCEYMNIDNCHNYYGGSNYGDDYTCGSFYGYPSSSSGGSEGSYGYCRYSNKCEYMNVDNCYNYYGGSNYGDDNTCGYFISFCGGSEYDPSIWFCYGGSIYYKCGGYSEYNPSTEFCSNGSVYYKCGGYFEYNPSTEFCSGGSVYPRCGGSEYDPSTQFCSSSSIYYKCGGYFEYNPSTEFCSGGSVYPRCGGSEYDLSTQFCFSDLVYSTCGGSKYDPSIQYCSNGTVRTYGIFTDFRDLQTYKTVAIGYQTWFAENLNYAAPESVCYNNNSANCNTYGRLYNWDTAMNGLESSIDTPSGVQGVCPVGWHLPSDAEWTILTDHVGSSTAGIKLKATTGWFNCGPDVFSSYYCEDTYGFSALPGGLGDSGGSFYDVGYGGYWWSANEDNSNDAYSRRMYYPDNPAGRGHNDKSNLFSVRCIQD